MKTIIYSALFALVASLGNAAQTSWTLLGVYDEGGDNKTDSSYTAYMFTTAVAAYDSWSTIKGSTAFASAAAKGFNMPYVSDGKYTDTTSVPQHDTLGIGLVAGTTYDFYALIINEDASKYYLTQTYSKLVSGGTTDTLNIAWGSQADATQGHTDAWKTVESVPEPFSGTLALLGMGVVALRRKMKKQKKA